MLNRRGKKEPVPSQLNPVWRLIPVRAHSVNDRSSRSKSLLSEMTYDDSLLSTFSVPMQSKV